MTTLMRSESFRQAERYMTVSLLMFVSHFFFMDMWPTDAVVVVCYQIIVLARLNHALERIRVVELRQHRGTLVVISDMIPEGSDNTGVQTRIVISVCSE